MKRDKFDKMMSDLIRCRANWTCERCGKEYPEGHRGGLEHSHIWGRRRHSVRWEPDNGLALCTGCHRHVSANPIDHEWLAGLRLGKTRCAEIRLQANSVRRWKKWEKDELYEKMKSEFKRMEALRAGGETGRIEFAL